MTPAMTPASTHRTAINRANSQHSTGPRSETGKQRSALHALTHGLTARTAVLPSEDPAAFEQHHRQFLDEFRTATPTETQVVHELADTSWRLNRIPSLKPAFSPAPRIAAPRVSKGTPQPPAPSPESLAPASATPPASSNSITIKDFPTTPPRMASFIQ
jgi:hypothetical protein